MKNRINRQIKPTTKKTKPQRLTVGQLEERYLSKMRQDGVKLHVIPTDLWDDDLYNSAIADCERRQISFSEFVQEALLRAIERDRGVAGVKLVPYMVPEHYSAMMQDLDRHLPYDVGLWAFQSLEQIADSPHPELEFDELILDGEDVKPAAVKKVRAALRKFLRAEAAVKAVAA